MVHLLYFHFLSRADITKRPFKLHLYLPFCNPLSADAFLPAITICAGRERVKEVDISDGNGIIKENDKKPVTSITDEAIEKISGYTDEQCSFIQRQHKELLRYSRDNNSNGEVAFVFNNSSKTKDVYSGTDDKLDFGQMLHGFELFVMHNHPRNSSYSNRDIRFIIENNNVKTLTIVKNNGEVEFLTKSDKYNKNTALIELKRCYKKYVLQGTAYEIDKAITAFLKNNKEMFIWKKS